MENRTRSESYTPSEDSELHGDKKTPGHGDCINSGQDKPSSRRVPVRRAAVQADILDSRLYLPGGALDSQTTETQFLEALHVTPVVQNQSNRGQGTTETRNEEDEMQIEAGENGSSPVLRAKSLSLARTKRLNNAAVAARYWSIKYHALKKDNDVARKTHMRAQQRQKQEIAYYRAAWAQMDDRVERLERAIAHSGHDVLHFLEMYESLPSLSSDEEDNDDMLSAAEEQAAYDMELTRLGGV
ncbi:hypothetical protein BV25DRAFT_1841445 [Artomyces pyxidatus]|uniref:Uncharacterized protein n=1 Tax=Artomyces pyxidatus TaxID=48021 RepID=A0ACB8SN68_9AGAM|nr:hypothetical protein BV25DRAFT_1841445 [Artomyces pyxidatus]